MSMRLGLAALCAACGIAQADVVAYWAFPSTVPASSVNFQIAWPVLADQKANAGAATLDTDAPKWDGSSGATGAAQGSMQYFTGTTINAVGATAAGSGLSMRSLLGAAEGKSIVMCFDNTNYENLVLSYAERYSGAGAATTISISYSSDGVTYTPFSSYLRPTTGTGSFVASPRVIDMSTADSLDNDGTAYIKITMTGFDLSSNTAAVRLDNIQINGTVIPTPAGAALLGVAGLLGARRRR